MNDEHTPIDFGKIREIETQRQRKRDNNAKFSQDGERPIINFETAIGLVAQRFYGSHNPEFSNPSLNELRYRTYGSLQINLDKGTWYDHETNEGGGVLDLIIKERGGTRQDAIRWLAGSLKEVGLRLRNDKAARAARAPGAIHPIRDTPVISEYVDKEGREWWRGREVEAVYTYLNERWETLFQVIRYPKGSGARFSQRRPAIEWGPGYWIPNLDGVRRVPYRLNEFAGKAPGLIFICEGEKDVDNLRKLKLGGLDFPRRWRPKADIGGGSADNAGKPFPLIYATTNPGGVGKWREEYNQFFLGFDVVILPDNDDVGRGHAEEVKGNLEGVAKSVRILELPELEDKGDVSDWVLGGGSGFELMTLIKSL